MTATSKASGRFKVGDWVTFPYGTRNLIAQVVEERGPLGIRGRHLYRIRPAGETESPDSFEMPEDELAAATPPDKNSVVTYLKRGGLVAILSSNLNGGPHQPRAWLTYTRRGELIHTFSPDRGVVGGATVPFFALHQGKVFAGKEGEVLTFLRSFGLNHPEAQDIIGAVGTAP
jgi:hypothetical protein